MRRSSSAKLQVILIKVPYLIRFIQWLPERKGFYKILTHFRTHGHALSPPSLLRIIPLTYVHRSVQRSSLSYVYKLSFLYKAKGPHFPLVIDQLGGGTVWNPQWSHKPVHAAWCEDFLSSWLPEKLFDESHSSITLFWHMCLLSVQRTFLTFPRPGPALDATAVLLTGAESAFFSCAAFYEWLDTSQYFHQEEIGDKAGFHIQPQFPGTVKSCFTSCQKTSKFPKAVHRISNQAEEQLIMI